MERSLNGAFPPAGDRDRRLGGATHDGAVGRTSRSNEGAAGSPCRARPSRRMEKIELHMQISFFDQAQSQASTGIHVHKRQHTTGWEHHTDWKKTDTIRPDPGATLRTIALPPATKTSDQLHAAHRCTRTSRASRELAHGNI